MEAPAFGIGPAAGGLDNGLIARIRLVLSSSVLFIIGPPDLDNPLGGFHVIAALYITYSALHSVFAERQVQPLFSKISYVADVSWAALLVAFSDESSTTFLFLFPILVASFQWSFAATICLTVVAAKLSVAIGFLQARLEEDLQLQRIFLAPIYLLVFGYLVARWGDREVTAKRRLTLLKEINRLSNPRFGIDRMIGKMMERLRAFYDGLPAIETIAPAYVGAAAG